MPPIKTTPTKPDSADPLGSLNVELQSVEETSPNASTSVNSSDKAEAKRLLVMNEMAALRQAYSDDPRQGSFNMLLLGESGSGKTFMTQTARQPIHIDSFDPGGSKGIDSKLINDGRVIVDSRYESENPLKPTMFDLWVKELNRRMSMGYFEHIGTYVLDSATTWSEAIMNSILKKANLAGQPPRFTHDYTPQKTIIRNCLRTLLDLPCDFILTGHLNIERDEASGSFKASFMTTGTGAITIPLLFDEVWVMSPKATASGVKYRILTQSTGVYSARSRMAKDGLLEAYEDPNIKAILKKAGKQCNDKPKLS